MKKSFLGFVVISLTNDVLFFESKIKLVEGNILVKHFYSVDKKKSLSVLFVSSTIRICHGGSVGHLFIIPDYERRL